MATAPAVFDRIDKSSCRSERFRAHKCSSHLAQSERTRPHSPNAQVLISFGTIRLWSMRSYLGSGRAVGRAHKVHSRPHKRQPATACLWSLARTRRLRHATVAPGSRPPPETASARPCDGRELPASEPTAFGSGSRPDNSKKNARSSVQGSSCANC